MVRIHKPLAEDNPQIPQFWQKIRVICGWIWWFDSTGQGIQS